jgi:hypothetical protein
MSKHKYNNICQYNDNVLYGEGTRITDETSGTVYKTTPIDRRVHNDTTTIYPDEAGTVKYH